MSSTKSPNIKSYLSISQFLHDFYQSRRDAEKEFSYQSWADELGISKSFLQFIVVGKRKISAEVAFKISKSIKLAGTDLDYFDALIDFSQARAEDEHKAEASKKLMQILRQAIDLTEVAATEALLSDPLHMTVRNVLSFSDIDRSAKSLSLMFKVSLEKMEQILSKLQAVDLITFDDNQWAAKQENVVIKQKLGSDLLVDYHKKILKRATEIDGLPTDLRHFHSLGLALDETQYQEYLKDMKDFATKTFAKFSGQELKSKRMYQLSFNAFPWTEEKFEPSQN